MNAMITKIVNKWCNSGVIDKDDEDIYIYGLDLLIFTIINLTVIFLTAFFMDKIIESVLLIIVIIPLQSYGGGYHAKTHLRCFLIMFIGWWIIIYIVPFISLIAAFLVNIISIFIIYCIAPVAHDNVVMSNTHKLKLRRFVRILAFCFCFISMFLLLFNNLTLFYGILLSSGIGISALSMIIAWCVRLIK